MAALAMKTVPWCCAAWRRTCRPLSRHSDVPAFPIPSIRSSHHFRPPSRLIHGRQPASLPFLHDTHQSYLPSQVPSPAIRFRAFTKFLFHARHKKARQPCSMYSKTLLYRKTTCLSAILAYDDQQIERHEIQKGPDAGKVPVRN